jgi:hypothetical protein
MEFDNEIYQSKTEQQCTQCSLAVTYLIALSQPLSNHTLEHPRGCPRPDLEVNLSEMATELGRPMASHQSLLFFYDRPSEDSDDVGVLREE